MFNRDLHELTFTCLAGINRANLRFFLVLFSSHRTNTENYYNILIFLNGIFAIFLYLAAIQSLKRKKRYEQQLTQIDGQFSTLEFQKEVLENARSNTEVLRCMSASQHALKLGTSDVHDLMDE